jgi:hypothetical protein
MKTGMQFTSATPPGLERALGVEASGFLGADGEVVQEDFGTRLPEGEDDLFVGGLGPIRGPEGARVGIVRHVVCHTIQDAAHSHSDACFGQVLAEDGGAVRGLEDCFRDVLSDFAQIDVEGGDHLDVVRPVASDLPVHETDGVLRLLVAVVLESLDQGAGAVSNAHNGNLDLGHRY